MDCPLQPVSPSKIRPYTCVDVVTVASCVKCLFKYVTKGADTAKARVSGVISEIEHYQKTRYESGAEANWRIPGFEVLNRTPAVNLVHAHLEGDNNVVFPATVTPEEHQQLANTAVSDLMRYFNRPNNGENYLTLLDYF